MNVILASSSWPSAVIAGLNSLLICTSLFVVAFWGCLALWTWRDIRLRTPDRRLQMGATLLVVGLFVGGWLVYRLVRPRQTLAQISERQREEESLLAEMAERQICTNCQVPLAPEFQVCPSCGQKYKQSCPRCDRLLERRWSFCPYCATKLGNTPMQRLASGPSPHPMGSSRF